MTGGRYDMENQESVYYARLVRLIIQEGTNRIRVKCLQNIINNMTLRQALASKKQIFDGLRKNKVITSIHYDILYPESDDPRLEDIDLTLWFVIARHLTNGKNKINWTKPLTDNDHKWQHEAWRLREIRNHLFHVPLPELSRREFRELWNTAVECLRKLGTDQRTLDEYRDGDLDPLQTQIMILQVREQVLEELHGVFIQEAKRRKQLRVVVPLVLLLVVAICLSFVIPLVIYLRNSPPCRKYVQGIATDQGVVQFMPREGWGARKPKHKLADLTLPMKNVVIMHTALIGECTDTGTCCGDVKYVQNFHMDKRDFDDVGYSFMIGGDGVVYEGRGWGKWSAAIPGWNDKIISLGFLGNFIYGPPTNTALQATQVFMSYLTQMNKTTSDYSLYAHCQLNPIFVDSPGEALYEVIKNWPHFVSHVNGSNCRGEDNTM